MEWHCENCMLRGRGDSLNFEDVADEDAEEESSSDDEEEGRDQLVGERVQGHRLRQHGQLDGVANRPDQASKQSQGRRAASRFLPVQLQFIMRAGSLHESMLEANNQIFDENKDNKFVLPFCKKSLLFMRQFKYVYLHPKNPLVAAKGD